VVPQLLPVTSGGKQWRDVGYENGSAFVAGNCLSFCYFAASKSQMSAGVLSQTITCRDNSYDDDVFFSLALISAIYCTYFLILGVLNFFQLCKKRIFL